MIQEALNIKQDVPTKLVLALTPLQTIEWELCRRDFTYWLFRWVKTLNEHASITSEDSDRFENFPHLNYLMVMSEEITDPEKMVYLICKSRQMMLTWIIIAYICWYALFHKNSRILMQSKKEEAAWDLIERLDAIYSKLPDFMKKYPVKKVKGKFVLGGENKSSVTALSQGAKQFKSYTSNIVFLDEAAEIEDLIEAVSCAMPGLIGSQDAKLFIVSTPEPSTDFETMFLDGEEWQG